MKMLRKMKRFTALFLSLILLVSGVVFESATTVCSAAGTYTFTSGDVRTVLGSVLKGEDPVTPLGSLVDRNHDGAVNTIDVRTMLNEIIAGNNTVTLIDDAFRLSSISDLTDSSGSRSYTVYAPYTDVYTLKCSNAKSIVLYSGNTAVASGSTTVNASLTAGYAYTLTIKTSYGNTAFEMSCVAKNHEVTLPYDVAEPADISDISLNHSGGYTIAASPLNYQKREGGTYVYCNNPEQIDYAGIGDAFIRDEGLTGDVFVTFEHSNISGYSFYLGYQVKNDSDHDVYITVTNIGYQTSGSWYGQKAWYDFYNTSFAFTGNSYDNTNYLFENYTPRVFQPITYRLPAGKYIYVVGGTTSDAYRNINVGGTANKYVYNKACANAAVKFTVTGGEVTGTMYCYRNTSSVKANPAETGYRVDTNYNSGESYGVQYVGSGDHHGVVDAYLHWTFNDTIGSGMLPVTYTNSYASKSNVATTKTPYGQYNNQSHTYSRAVEWVTHINPQDINTAVGTDMVAFRCRDTNGVERVVDVYHADGTGSFGNFGNWMIEYQEHVSLVNQGNKERTVTMHYLDNGALLMMARDSLTGEVLSADFPIGGDTTGYNYTYDIVVPAHSSKQITMTYLLMPMSAGFVSHMATIN